MPDTLARWIDQHQITHIECILPDLNGAVRGKLVPVSHYPAPGGLRFPQVSLIQSLMGDPQQQLVPETDPDMVLIPDLSSLRLRPGQGRRTAQLFHDCQYADGTPVPYAPRTVLKRILARYSAAGLTPVVAPEIEFYLVNPDGSPAESGSCAYSLDHSQQLETFFAQLEDACHQQGIATDTLLHEVGKGQYELNLQHGDALQLADQVILLKRTLSESAARIGLKACFMAKPFSHDAGSAMHIHQSVLDDEGRNAFSLPDGSPHPRFAHFIAGLQHYLPQAMVLFAPSPNSYRRLRANSAAPINVAWGYDNRSCGLRVPESPPQARRIENRLPGIDANPYLALACMLACGLLGIEKALSPTAPLAHSAYGLPHALPKDLPTALAALASCDDLHELLGSTFIQSYIALKEVEWQDFCTHITAWESEFLM